MKTRIDRNETEVHIILCADTISEAAQMVRLLEEVEGGIMEIPLDVIIEDRHQQ